MKHFFTLLALFFCHFVSMAKDGYKLKVQFKQNMNDSTIYLAHYFGKNLPTIFKMDSVKVKNNTAVLEHKEAIIGGVYMIIFNNNSKLVEFLLDNGQAFEMLIDTSPEGFNVLKTTTFKNSPENDRYKVYNNDMESFAQRGKAATEQMANAKNASDSAKVMNSFQQIGIEQKQYRLNYIQKYPNTLLSTIFKAVQIPDVPAGTHYLEDGKTVDSLFAYQYYKDHYWDGFDLRDDRLIHTPLYDSKLNEFFNKWVIQIPDSVIYEANKLLKATKGTQELFKYTLRTLTTNMLQSKVMGMDEVFVYLVENYYMKGAATWLSEKDVEWYEERAKKIAPNVLGNIAPDLNMQDVFTLKDKPLHGVQAKYTLLIIWSYDCGTCQKEVPQVDSIYRAVLKDKGLKVYSVASGGEMEKVHAFIKKNKIEEWINVGDTHGDTQFKTKYDAFTTPKLYLLNEEKKIIGKGLDHSNIATVIDLYERKMAAKK